jgi:hypothetical protein
MWEALDPSPMPVLLAAQGWYFFDCSRGIVPSRRCQSPWRAAQPPRRGSCTTLSSQREAQWQASFLVAAAVVAARRAAAHQLCGAGFARAAGDSTPPPSASQVVPASSSRSHMRRSTSSNTSISSISSSSSRAAAAFAAAPAAAAAAAGRGQQVGWATCSSHLVLKCSCHLEGHCLHVCTALSFVCQTRPESRLHVCTLGSASSLLHLRSQLLSSAFRPASPVVSSAAIIC